MLHQKQAESSENLYTSILTIKPLFQIHEWICFVLPFLGHQFNATRNLKK